jgi:hypothetical protein
MNYTKNTLEIQSIQHLPYNEDNSSFIDNRADYQLEAEIQCNCTVTGRLIARINITVEYEGYAYETKSMKQLIQNFVNGDFYSELKLTGIGGKSQLSNKIHHFRCLIGEPYETIFNQIFNPEEWEIPSGKLIQLNP